MLLTPEWRNRLFVCGAIVLALIGAVQIASGSAFWAILLCGAGLAIVLGKIQPVPLGSLALGLTMAGYIIGSRGFAQLSLAGGAPLLPAEFALLVGGCAILARSISRRELPLRWDPLNILIILWIVVGTARVVFDIKRHGFLAVRDYALVYYATFFFIAQYLAKEPISRRFLYTCLYTAGFILLVIQPFYALYPDFFYTQLTVRNVPLILFKDDLLGSALAITSLLFFQLFEEKRRIWYLCVSLAALIPVLTTNNRASVLGLVVGTVFLAIGRRWRFAVVQVVGGAAAALLIVLVALAQNKSWESTPVFEFYERIVSIADPTGSGSYRGENTHYKGANNAFRTVWWETTINETVEGNPWIGLGFGHDLAQRFLERYYPTSEEDFTVRSPHNVIITTFARMGLVGLVPFLLIVGLVVRGAFRAVRLPKEQIKTGALWSSLMILLTAACFGVVLEGPMGAVVFWTLLGLGYHELSTARKQENKVTDGSLSKRNVAFRDETQHPLGDNFAIRE